MFNNFDKKGDFKKGKESGKELLRRKLQWMTFITPLKIVHMVPKFNVYFQITMQINSYSEFDFRRTPRRRGKKFFIY